MVAPCVERMRSRALRQGGRRTAGTVSGSTNVLVSMARNPDPKPGRWILPLIVIGMIAFTYVFVNNLDDDAAAAPVTLPESTTTTISDIEPIDVESTVPESDPAVAAYIDQVNTSQSDLTSLSAEMASINEQWDARDVEFSTARDFLRDDLNPRIAQWVTRVEAIEAPVGFEDSQAAVVVVAPPVSAAADAVLDGLEAPDTGEARRAALEQFNAAVEAFNTAAAAAVGG